MSYFFIFLSILFTGSSARYLDPDLGWHLYLGKNMVESNRVTQFLDGYSSFKDISLPNHEWLSDIFLFLIYNKFGYIALIILSFFVLVLIAVIMLKIDSINNTRKEISTLSIIILMLSLSSSYGVRLQIILFLAVALLLLIQKTVERFSYRLLIYFLLFLVGNNFHGGFSTLLIIPLLLEFNFIELKKSFFKTLIILVVLISATTLNPYGFTYWELAYDYLNNTYYQNRIFEWRSAFDFPIFVLNLFLPLSIYIFALTIYRYWKRISINEVLLILIYLVLALKYVRFFPIFAIIITPYFSKALSEIINVKTNKFTYKFGLLATIFLIPIIVLRANIFDINTLSNPFHDPDLDTAMIAVKHNLIEKEIVFLNPYNKGGYILWTSPEIKVFIDGRGPQTKVAESTLLEEYSAFFSKDHDLISEQLQKYNISLILIEKEDNSINKINQLLYQIVTAKSYHPINELDEYLSNNPQDWQRKYENSRFAVYRKI